MKHSCVEGSNVDDDNESAPENIPNLNQVHEVAHKLIKVSPYSKFFGGRWVKCYQQSTNSISAITKTVKVESELCALARKMYLDVFRVLVRTIESI
jgi:hypothetical protein